jgi:hypothetical protein
MSLGTPGSSPAPAATLERGAPRDKQAKTENEMALLSPCTPFVFATGQVYNGTQIHAMEGAP